MLARYRSDQRSIFFLQPGRPFDGAAPDWRAATIKKPPMTNLSKTLISAAALAAITASAAFSQVAWEFNPGMAYMYGGPGKMTAMAMAAGEKNHSAMMKSAAQEP